MLKTTIKILAVAFILVSILFFKGDTLTPINAKNINNTEKNLIVSQGKIFPKTQANVISQIPGIVEELYVEIGDAVKKGEALAKIKPMISPFEIKNLKRKLTMSKINLDKIKTDYDRAAKLLEKNLISKKEFENIEREYKSAMLNYSMISDKYNFIALGKFENKEQTKVLAPISGIVLDLYVNSGNTVATMNMYRQGTVLMTIADMNELIFKGNIRETDVSKISVGQETLVTVLALNNKIVKGKISQISPKAKAINNESYFGVQIDIEPSDISNIMAGFTATAQISPDNKKLWATKSENGNFCPIIRQEKSL